MATGPRYRVQFRRRREGKTDYRYRLKSLKSRLPRAVVRKSLKNTIVQFIEYDSKGDKILATASTLELKKLGWAASTSTTPAAYLVGLLAGKRAMKKEISEAVFDAGLQKPTKGSKMFASLKGMLDAGIVIPHGDSILPSEGRLKGEHLDENLAVKFEEVKNRILEEVK
jgi:large subunit ribosomal protein L18